MKSKTVSRDPKAAPPRSPDGIALRRVECLPPVSEAWKSDLGTLYRGDMLTVLPTLPDASYQLVFADPPFDLGKAYGDSVDDRRGQEKYLDWCRNWLDELVRLLADGGSLFVYNLPRWNVHLAAYLEGKLTFRHWIAVDIKYWFPIANRLYPAHYSLLYFCKGPRPTIFQPPRQPMITCRHCGMELKDYGGYKAKLDPAGFNLSDVWSDISPVRHTRYKTPNRAHNQLPLKMLDRILDMSSAPGDKVLDPFAGSGTSLVAAELKHRQWTGVEIESVQPIIDRFAAIEGDRRLLEDLGRTKNRLFTDGALRLRKRLGHPLGNYRILDSQRDLVDLGPHAGDDNPSERGEPSVED